MRGRLHRMSLLILLAALCCGCNPYRYPGASPAVVSQKLYVTDSGGGTVSVIDLEASRKYREIWVGSTPHGLGVSPDQQSLYVSIESSHLLREIDTRTDEIIRSVRLTDRPNQLAVSPDGRWIYVALIRGGRVDIVDSQTFRVAETLPVGRAPHNCFVSRKGASVYVTSILDRLVHEIDPHSRTITQTIRFSGNVRPITVDSAETTIYAALEGLHGFAVANIEDGMERNRVSHPLPPTEERWENAYLLTHGLELSPDESQLWVTSFVGRRLLVFNIESEPTPIDTVEVGQGPTWLTFDPEGRFLYVSNASSNTVSIVDAEIREELKQVKVGPSPKRLLVVQQTAKKPDS